jgi:hypothetical protein
LLKAAAESGESAAGIYKPETILAAKAAVVKRQFAPATVVYWYYHPTTTPRY